MRAAPLLVVVLSLCGCAAVMRMASYQRPPDPQQKRLYEMQAVAAPEQLREYEALADSASRQRYWEKFWKEKDPTPTTDSNERYAEHLRRVAYADGHFKTLSFYWDDRGKIYIKFGEPDEREMHPLGEDEFSSNPTMAVPREETGARVGRRQAATYAWERWTYHRLERELYFVERDVGYRLTRDLASAKDAAPATTAQAMSAIEMDQPMVTAAPAGDAYFHDYGVNLRYPFGLSRFADPMGAEAWVYYSVPLRAVRCDSAGEGRLKRSMVVFNADMNEIGRSEAVLKPVRPTDSARMGESQAIDMCRFHLWPGAYTVAISVEDEQSGKIGIYKYPFIVVDYRKGAEEVSDLMLATEIDFDGGAGKFRRAGYRIVPQASGSFKRNSSLFVYFEAYNFRMGKDSLYRAEITHSIMPKKKEKASFTLPATVESSKPDILRATELSLAGLKKGEYILLVEIKDLVSGKVRKQAKGFTIF